MATIAISWFRRDTGLDQSNGSPEVFKASSVFETNNILLGETDIAKLIEERGRVRAQMRDVRLDLTPRADQIRQKWLANRYSELTTSFATLCLAIHQKHKGGREPKK